MNGQCWANILTFLSIILPLKIIKARILTNILRERSKSFICHSRPPSLYFFIKWIIICDLVWIVFVIV